MPPATRPNHKVDRWFGAAALDWASVIVQGGQEATDRDHLDGQS
jgi:hypothetical protein